MTVRGRRVAVIGAGLAAAPWFAALDDLGVEVVTVVTRDRERFARVSARFPRAVQCWPPERALDPPGLDACVILSPPAAHLDGIRMAADRGLPILVEKPLEVTLQRSVAAARIAERAGVPLAVCLQFRYREGAVALRDLLARGALGSLRAATLELPWWRTDDYYREPGRGSYARDGGGVLITQAIHALDLLVWLAGAPTWVTAELRRASFHPIEAEDLAMALLGTKDGALCSVVATTGAHSAEPVRIRLLGTDRTAVLLDNMLTVFRDGGRETVVGEPPRPADGPMDFPFRWHRALITDALDAFAAGSAPPVGAREAVTAQSLIAAIELSAARRERVSVTDPWR